VHRHVSLETSSASHRSPSSCPCRFRQGLIDLYSNVCDDNDGGASVGAASCFPLVDCALDSDRQATFVCWEAGAAMVLTSPNNRRWKTVIHSASAIALFYS
jgi:hypothetical protein